MLSQTIFNMIAMKGTNLFILAKTKQRYSQERRTHVAVAVLTATAIFLARISVYECLQFSIVQNVKLRIVKNKIQKRLFSYK